MLQEGKLENKLGYLIASLKSHPPVKLGNGLADGERQKETKRSPQHGYPILTSSPKP